MTQKWHIVTGEELDWLNAVNICIPSKKYTSVIKKIRARKYDPQAERETVLESLKKDLQTRFISSNNQWSKGRNYGLIECCNIIDEELRQESRGSTDE